MDYPVMKIATKELCDNDWVEDEGLVVSVSHYSTLSLVRFAHHQRLTQSLVPVWVRIEDHGQTE